MKPLILVTGATGKTGTPVAEQLLRKGYPVRALAHSLDERSKRLQSLGAEVVLGDLEDLSSIRKAMKGVKRVYFVYPPQEKRLVDATAIAAAAARDAGVEALVNMSQLPARENAPSELTRQHWLSENIFDWADIGAIHIRPTFFSELFYLFNGPTIATEGKIYLPFGAESHAPIAAEDIARVVVALLISPSGHTGERHVLTGPQNLTMAQAAAVFTRELGRPVDYVEIPIPAWGQILTEKAGIPEFLANHLMAVAQDHHDGVFNAATDVVERIGGNAPKALDEFIRENISEFAGASKTIGANHLGVHEGTAVR